MKTKNDTGTDVYLQLVQEFPLKPIRTAAQHDAALAVSRRLMLRPAGTRRDAGERDYLDVLSGLIDAYERRTMSPLETTPLERLRFILDESGMTQAGFATVLGVGQPAASLIMNGRRGLTIDAVKRLAGHFKVEPGYFI
jgi:HTH-type transcriptional regulator/antitoxin HigA